MFKQNTSTVLFAVLVMVFLPLWGCNIVGVLTQPGPFEKKIPPQYDLAAQQNRKILLLIECPRSSGVDYDVKKKLLTGFQVYLASRMDIKPKNILLPQADNTVLSDPIKMAQSQDAGYILLVQVDGYRLSPLNTRNYFTGEMVSRAMLMDADLGATVWPEQPGGKTVQIGVDLEIKGRDAALSRLISGTTHCILRYFYPCEKLKFKKSDEVMTLQDAFEMETF